MTDSERHRLLSSARRRRTIDVLADRSGPIDLEDLARVVAAREGGGPPVDAETVARLEVLLHHQHLPTLAEYGLVDYDPHENRVEPRLGLSEVLTE